MDIVETEFVDRMYEAAFIPERWPKVLEQLSVTSDAYGAALLAMDLTPIGATASDALRYVTTAPYAPAYDAYISGGSGLENVRPKRALEQRHAGFQRDLDLCSPDELAGDELYRRFLRPHGIGWTAGTTIAFHRSEVLVFDVCRRTEDGPFTTASMTILDSFRPHLARAAMLSSKLGLDRARAKVEALAAVGLPTALVTSTGKVRAANALFDGLSPQVSVGQFDRLLVDHEASSAMLNAVLTTSSTGAEVRSIPVPSIDGRAALVVHVIPVRLDARDLFTGIAAMVVAISVEAPCLPFADLLAGLFDLSPAEARLARAVAGGITLQDYADSSAISAETARTQLKSVMNKTGMHRQIDLVRLFVAAAPLGRGPKRRN